MIRNAIAVINDFSGGQDTKTPIISMGLNKSPNMRNFHCAGVKERLMKRGGFAKVNSSAVSSDLLDVAYPPGYQTYDYNLRDVIARSQISQGFKCNTSSTVTKVRLWIKKVGTPAGTDTVTLVIQTNSSGIPSGTAVTNGTSTAVDISDTITTSYAWVTFTFATNPSLTAGTQYHLVLQGAFTISTSNYIVWGADNFDVIYADGNMSYALAVAQADIKSLLHFDGSDGSTTFTDEQGKVWTAVGNAQIDTAQSKFGTASGLFDGTGDYITTPDHADFALASNDWTFDFWVRFNAIGAGNTIFSQGTDSSNYHYFGYESSQWIFKKRGGTEITWQVTDSSITTATWYHVAIVRNGNTWYVFRDGILKGTTSISTALVDYTGVFALGIFHYGSGTGANELNGWLDEFRFLTIARWTDSFTPATSAYSYAAETVFSADTNYDAIFEVYITGGAKGDDGYASWDFSSKSMLLGVFGTTIYKMDKNSAGTPDGTWESLSAITSSRYWTFGDWLSGRALINTDIGLYTYTGTGVVSAVSGAPIGKFFTIWRNYCFIFGIRGNANQGRYSDLSDYTTWTATNTLNFNTNDGDVITGVRILKGKLFVFKRYSVHRVTYLGSNPTFQVDQILGIGTPAHYSIKEVDMGGELGSVLVFLTTDKKLAIFDGYNIQVISDVLTEETNDLFAAADDQPKTFSDMNLVYADLFHAVVKQDTYEYILYCVLDSDTSVNYAFVLDYKTGGIYPYDGQIFASSCYAISTNKSKLLYTAGYSGFMWQMESGNSDDGSAINAYWVSGKIKPALVSLMTKALQVGLNFKEVTSASTLNLALQYRIDWNVSWTTAENHNFDHNDELAFGKTSLSDIGTIENMLQIKLKDNSTNPAPTLYGIDLLGVPLGSSVGDRAVA